jgi:hypothetical protein
MTAPLWYYKEAIEHELERLGAQTWRYQDDPARFRNEEQANPADVELTSAVYGAVVSDPAEILKTLGQLHDSIGDDKIADALFGHNQPDQERGAVS